MTPSPHDSASGSLARSFAGALSRSAIGRFSRILGASSRMQRTGKFLRRSVWVWPILAAVILGAAGWSVHRVVENAMREQRAAELNVMADAGVAAVEAWMTEQRRIAELYAQDEQTESLVDELLKTADAAAKDPAAKDPADIERRLIQSPAQAGLRARLKPRLATSHHVGYFVVSSRGLIVAADQDAAVGKSLAGYRQEIFAKAVAGGSLVSKPFPSPLLLPDEHGELRTNLPTMFTIAPFRDDEGRGFAALLNCGACGLAPSSAPTGHLLPRGEKEDMPNRRKWCALNGRHAHNCPLVVRVGALTNKGAHYGFDVVHTGQGVVRGLTSISSATSGNICRVRRGAVVRPCYGVRDFTRGRALRETATGRRAQQIVGAAHENVRFAHDARSIMCGSGERETGSRPS